MKVFFIGVGAAGNAAVTDAVESGIINVDDTCIINSTARDFPKEYEGEKIVLTDTNTGCGKERQVSKEYTKAAIGKGIFTSISDKLKNNGYLAVAIITSVEGGTGSGSTPLIAKFFNQVCRMNTHIIAFTGFEEDVRGLSNTVEFFKEIDPEIIVQTVSNASFLPAAGGNKLKAEELANKEMAERISVLTGQDFIDGRQNIDDTDILKLSNTSGYMTIEKKYFNKPLETRDSFEKIIKNMLYNSASVKTENPYAVRLGVILNVSEASEDAVDYSFTSIRKAYGDPFEYFTQVQWDGKKEYIAFIASGMKMPLDEIKAVYERYKEQTSKINKNGDEFFTALGEMNTLEEDNKFNMMKEERQAVNLSDFLASN